MVLLQMSCSTCTSEATDSSQDPSVFQMYIYALGPQAVTALKADDLKFSLLILAFVLKWTR